MQIARKAHVDSPVLVVNIPSMADAAEAPVTGNSLSGLTFNCMTEKNKSIAKT